MDGDITTSSSNVQLPDIAIHSILSSLPPVDAIRASATSRQWRSAWISSPTLSFDENPCPLKNSDFFDYVDRSIALWRDRCDSRVNLEKLSLSAAVEEDQLASRLEQVVAFAADRNVKAIELANQSVHFRRVPYDSSLWALLLTCKSLEALSLRCFQFFGLNPSPIKSDSVKKLSLNCTLVNDTALANLISCFPLLEDLELGICVGLYQIIITSPSLKKFQTLLCDDFSETVLIDAQNLQSFKYARSFRAPGVIKFLNCKSLTSLTFDVCIFDPENTNSPIQDYISQIPLLESLTLDNCKFAGGIQICHSYLKRLNLKSSYGFKRVAIDTPNLCYFKYFGGVFHFDAFRYRYGFLEADLGLCTCSFDDTEWFWFVKLRNFLENFNKGCSVVLDCYVEGFPEELRDNDFLPDPFFEITHLTLTNKKLALEDCIHFVAAMVELFPCLETLTLKTPFAIVSIKYDESGSFDMEWVPTVGASNTAKYGVDYQFIREVMNELVEYLQWSGDDMEEGDKMEEDEDTLSCGEEGRIGTPNVSSG